MGAQTLKACCHVHTEGLPPNRRTVASAPITGPWPGMMPGKEFEERYTVVKLREESSEDGFNSASENSIDWTGQRTNSKCSKVKALVRVQSKNTGFYYDCRRVPKATAPCEINSVDGEQGVVLQQHLRALCRLKHPHLCQVVECFEHDGDIVIICEIADTPNLVDLASWNGQTNEREAAEFVRQLVSGLSHAHSRGLAHGMLRPEVILCSLEDPDLVENDLKSPQLKISDMGIGFVLRPPLGARGGDAASMLDESADIRAHPLVYSAPETIYLKEDKSKEGDGDPSTNLHEFEWKKNVKQPCKLRSLAPDDFMGASPEAAYDADMWAIGAIAYHLLTGAPPFVAKSTARLRRSIRETPVAFLRWPWDVLTVEAGEAVESLLRMNPLLRPTAAQMLRHPWLEMPRQPLPPSSLHSLYSNALLNLQEGQFKKLVLRVIARQLPHDHPHIEEALRVFHALDSNQDGLVDEKEFVSGFGEAASENSPEDLAEKLFDSADRDGSGTLDPLEFVALTMPQEVARDDWSLHRVFEAFDREEMGVLTMDKILATARLLEGPMISETQLDGLEQALCNELQALKVAPDDETLASVTVAASRVGASLADRVNDISEAVQAFAAGPRYRDVDFGDFVFLCGEDGSKFKQVSKKEIYRLVKRVADINMYQIDAWDPPTWPAQSGKSPQGCWSAYVMDGGLLAKADHWN